MFCLGKNCNNYLLVAGFKTREKNWTGEEKAPHTTATKLQVRHYQKRDHTSIQHNYRLDKGDKTIYAALTKLPIRHET